MLNKDKNEARLRAQLAERHGRAIPGVAVQNPVAELDRVMTILVLLTG